QAGRDEARRLHPDGGGAECGAGAGHRRSGLRAGAGTQSIRGKRSRATRRSGGQTPLPRRVDAVYSRGFIERRPPALMRIAWPSAIASAVLAMLLIAILIGFQIPVAKSAPAPAAPPAHPAPVGPRHGEEMKSPSAGVQRG